jgi:hypothetical protein
MFELANVMTKIAIKNFEYYAYFVQQITVISKFENFYLNIKKHLSSSHQKF